MQGPLRGAAALAAVASVALTSCHHAAVRAARAPVTPATTQPLLVKAAPFPRPSGVVVHGSRRLPLVALTFDTNMTDHMLAELDRHQVESFVNRRAIDELDGLGVTATVFLAGKWIERYPDETRRLAHDPLLVLAQVLMRDVDPRRTSGSRAGATTRSPSTPSLRRT